MLPVAAVPVVEISVEDDLWNTFPDLEDTVRVAVEKALARGTIPGPDTEVSVVLANDAFVRTLNRDYRGKDAPTNVLSFAAHDAEGFDSSPCLGDIVLAYETLVREAGEAGISFRAHFLHLLTHGTLHLLGYDHETDADAEEMEQLEVSILQEFGLDNPYATKEQAKE